MTIFAKEFEWKTGYENHWMRVYGILTRIYTGSTNHVVIESEKESGDGIQIDFESSDEIPSIKKSCERIVEELSRPVSSMDFVFVSAESWGGEPEHFFTTMKTENRTYMVKVFPYEFGERGYFVKIEFENKRASILIKDRYGLDKELERMIPILEKEVFKTK